MQNAIEAQFAGLIGAAGAKQVHDMLVHGQQSTARGLVGTILGALGLLIGATGAFLSLQDALNHAWEVKPDPDQGGVKRFFFKRLISLGMVLGLRLSCGRVLALSAALSAFTSLLAGTEVVLQLIDLVVSLVVLTVLFAALFRLLPDVRLQWRDVAFGGAVTAVLFVAGKFLIGLYLGRAKPGDAFGAASAIAVLLVWIYYAGMIVLFGAELTREWAGAHGRGVEPRAGTVRVVEQEIEEPARPLPVTNDRS